MKNSKHKSTGQSTKVSEIRKKQDTNLQKNHLAYFQIGLILCLLATYSLLELQLPQANITPVVLNSDDPIIEVAMTDIRLKTPQKKVEKKANRSSQLFDTIKIQEDDFPLKEDIITLSDSHEEVVESIDSIEVYEPEEVINIANVSKVPVFPGCEQLSERNELIKCMSDKIGKIVRRKFNTGIAEQEGLRGMQRIYVEFKIDVDGNITEIRSRAPHPRLEDEAKRVINKLPQMQPGYQDMKPVQVLYSLPIKFQIRE